MLGPRNGVLAEFVLRSVRIGRIVRGRYADEPFAKPFDFRAARINSETKRRALWSILARIRRASSRSRASEMQWRSVTETNFDRRWEAALDDELLGMPPSSDEGQLLVRILTDARRRRAFCGAPKLPSEILRLASSAEGRTLSPKLSPKGSPRVKCFPSMPPRMREAKKGLPLDRGARHLRMRRTIQREKPDESASNPAHRKPRLWWAADGWWLEWPLGGRLLAATAVDIYPSAAPYLALHGQHDDEREERSLRAAAPLQQQRFSDFQRLRRLNREN